MLHCQAAAGTIIRRDLSLVADPTGVEYHEPFPNNPDLSVYRVTHFFWPRQPGLPELGGDVALLCPWSSYENRHVQLAAAVTLRPTPPIRPVRPR